MKRNKFVLATMLMSVCSVLSAQTIQTIPTTDEPLDPKQAEIIKSSDESAAGTAVKKGDNNPNNYVNFDSFRPGDKAVFTLNNTIEQNYLITFDVSSKNDSCNLELIVKDENGKEELHKKVVINNNKDWTVFLPYAVFKVPLTTGKKTFTMVFNCEKQVDIPASTVNVRNIRFSRYAYDSNNDVWGTPIPCSLDLNAGKRDGGGVKEVDGVGPTLDNFRNEKSIAWDIYNPEKANYTISFNTACNVSNVKLKFEIINRENDDVEITQDVEIPNNKSWSDFSTEKEVELENLAEGAKIMKITFISSGNSATTNVANIKVVKSSTAGIHNMENVSSKNDGFYYTLAGIRTDAKSVKDLSKGIYIVNGKKVVVR